MWVWIFILSVVEVRDRIISGGRKVKEGCTEEVILTDIKGWVGVW